MAESSKKLGKYCVDCVVYANKSPTSLITPQHLTLTLWFSSYRMARLALSIAVTVLDCPPQVRHDNRGNYGDSALN